MPEKIFVCPSICLSVCMRLHMRARLGVALFFFPANYATTWYVQSSLVQSDLLWFATSTSSTLQIQSQGTTVACRILHNVVLYVFMYQREREQTQYKINKYLVLYTCWLHRVDRSEQILERQQSEDHNSRQRQRANQQPRGARSSKKRRLPIKKRKQSVQGIGKQPRSLSRYYSQPASSVVGARYGKQQPPSHSLESNLVCTQVPVLLAL